MKSEKFWNRRAGTYDSFSMPTYGKTYQDTIGRSRKYLNKNQIALDIGCGSGITTIALSKSVKELFAIDTAEKMIEVAREKSRSGNRDNIHFEVAEIFDTRYEEGSFDAIMAFNILCYIKNLDVFLARIRKLLKSDGIFLSATDCWGEKRTVPTDIQLVLCRLGVFPYKRDCSVNDLEAAFHRTGFQILESINLHDKYPNQFIAAKRNCNYSETLVQLQTH